MSRRAEVERNTKETQIRVTLEMGEPVEPDVRTGLPFLDHMLTAMAFHGGFGLTVRAEGDTDVDPHHVVEDTGIVIGSPVSVTSTPRFRPSVADMEIVRIQLSPKCCWTSSVSLT